MNKPVLFLVGPTASGKSDIALQLALKLQGEIISADSMQIYRGMDIGTAKPSQDDLCKVKHHLIDILNVNEVFSAYDFYTRAMQIIEKVLQRGHLPMVVGGTGFYVRTLLHGIAPNLGNTDHIRSQYEALCESEGLDALFTRLQSLDPERASKINPRDKKRIIRAFEIYEITGCKKPSEMPDQCISLQKLGYDPIVAGLTLSREKLYARIDKRVDKMIQQGLVKEAEKLKKLNVSKTAAQSLGYREIFDWLDGREQSLKSAILKIKQNTRHLAKRQWTWFKKEQGITWFEADHPDVLNSLRSWIQEKIYKKSLLSRYKLNSDNWL